MKVGLLVHCHLSPEALKFEHQDPVQAVFVRVEIKAPSKDAEMNIMQHLTVALSNRETLLGDIARNNQLVILVLDEINGELGGYDFDPKDSLSEDGFLREFSSFVVAQITFFD